MHTSSITIVAIGKENEHAKAHAMLERAQNEAEFEAAAYAIASTHGCGCYCTFCCM